MNKIILYLGLNVNKLRFNRGGGQTGLNPAGIVTINAVEDTYRAIPEAGLHAHAFAEYFINELNHTLPNWNIHISTNSSVPIDILGELIRDNKIPANSVEIYLMNEDNSEIDTVVHFDEDGYLMDNWVCGFLNYDYDLIDNFNVGETE